MPCGSSAPMGEERLVWGEKEGGFVAEKVLKGCDVGKKEREGRLGG